MLALCVATAEARVAEPAHGRAWELVTPPDPNAAPPTSVSAVAPGGDRVLYDTVGPLPGSQAGSLKTPSYAKRTPLGWDSVSIALPYSVPEFSFFSPEIVGASQDLARWVWSSPHPMTPDAPSTGTGMYGSNGTEGVATLLASVAMGFEFAGGSSDMRRLVFKSSTALLPEDVRTSGGQVYQLTGAGLELAGVDGSGSPLSTCGATVGSSTYPQNPVSRDGRRIFITSPDAACGTVRRRVYLREDGVTTEISTSRCSRAFPACNAPADVRFMGATPSGSVAFLATTQQLTDDDVDTAQDLYRYEVATGALARVSAGPVSAGVTATAAYPSDDGSRVYFLASGALVPGEGIVGRPNVYVADGEGLRFVTAIMSTDTWQQGAFSTSGREDVQLTPDGTRLVFVTTAPLIPDDTDSSKDVYLYDAEDDTLERISGLPGAGNGAFAADIAQGVQEIPTAGHPLRSLSVDGRHVFFKTDESLTPGDGNTTTDVYEWEDGDLGLVSSGGASMTVRYNTASADGSSVFFMTYESLTPDDDDGGDADLYVARKGGGFPAGEDRPDACADGGCASRAVTRISRAIPASIGFAEAADGLSVLPVSRAARQRAAASGLLDLRVQTPQPDRIEVRVRARVGGRDRTIASGGRKASRAGIVRIRLRLSRLALRHLGAGRALSVRVVARRSGDDSTTRTLKIERPR